MKKKREIHLFPGLLHWKQKSTYIHCHLSIRVGFMNCGTRGCENLWWNLPFFPFFFNFLFSIQQQCVERILCRCLFFSPCVYILRQNSLSAATWWAMWGKKSGLLRVKSILCKFWKENVSRAWFLNLFGLHFKTFFKKTSYFTWFASFREEIRICDQR